MYCPNCGKQIVDGAKFCDSCGVVLNDQFRAAPPHAYAPLPLATGSPTAQPPLSAQQAYEPPQAAYYQQPAYINTDLTSPLSVGSYVGMLLLMLIPLANLILLFIWSFSSGVNQNKKNLARAMLILALISVGLSILLSGTLATVFSRLFYSLY